MGILKNLINAKVSGNVGAMNFRKRGNQVVVAERSYGNSSKGGGATYKQRLHRVRIANVSAVFKNIKEIQARGWEFKTAGVSDANMFMQANLANSPIFLSMQEAKASAAVMCNYKVSEGSLPTLEQKYDSLTFHSGVMVGTDYVVGQNSVGALSSRIIEKNASFKNGDKITFCGIRQKVNNVGEMKVPNLEVFYFELTIDEASVEMVSAIPNRAVFLFDLSETGEIICKGTFDFCFAIHSRQLAGKLYTSTQFACMKGENSTYKLYSSEAQKEKAMVSYGYKPDVLLTPAPVEDPSAAVVAVVDEIKYGGQTFVSGSTIQAGSELAIVGSDLNERNAYVVNEGVILVPIEQGSLQKKYSINRNGTLQVVINGSVYATARVEGAVLAFTEMTFNGTKYTESQSNVTIDAGKAVQIEIKGSDLGTITATNGTITNASGDATARTATFTAPSAGTEWVIMVGGFVVISGRSTGSSGGGEIYD